MNLIDRQDAIDAIAGCTTCRTEEVLREYVAMHNLDNMWSGGILEALDAVKDLPSAQPERKKGKWINKDGGLATCSACGERWGVWSVMNYCPNCGACMKGDTK